MTEPFHTDLGYLERIKWKAGTMLYCRKCDAKVTMTPVRTEGGWRLRDSAGHLMHPAQAVVTGEVPSE